MTFGPAVLAARLGALEEQIAKPARLIVAFSGGLDSSVLAHCIAALRQSDDRYTHCEVLLLHVDHGLHESAADWSKHCATFAKSLQLDYQCLRVSVDQKSGKGLEAAARDARYSAMHAVLRDGDWLLSAHHADDQAETLLLNLVRGSGPVGLAGIAAQRRFGPGWLVRPLLEVPQSAIREYAQSVPLYWIDDPANDEIRFDRNYLRHEVMPVLEHRWPDVARRLQRSAAHAGDAFDLLSDLAHTDLQSLGGRPAKLPLDALTKMSPARQKNTIRFALRELGLSAPSTDNLRRVLSEVIDARIDAQPEVSWPGTTVRRYRDNLYLLPQVLFDALEESTMSGREQCLGSGLGTLKLEHKGTAGLSESLIESGLVIRQREGGEEIKLYGQSHTRKLKKLLQEEGVVPWMRDRLPLLYSGERLVAVADLWLADDAVSEPGLSVHWIDRPALH